MLHRTSESAGVMAERDQFASASKGDWDIDVPSGLKESVTRHQWHLAALVLSLRSAGLEEAQIERSVRQLVASYETELIGAVKALMKAAQHA